MHNAAFDQQWIAEVKPLKTLGTIIGAAFVAMAAIPITIGAVIFAPVVVPLALICVSSEGGDKPLKTQETGL